MTRNLVLSECQRDFATKFATMGLRQHLPSIGQEKNQQHKHFGRDGLPNKLGPVPGTNWDPSLGQTGARLLLNSPQQSGTCKRGRQKGVSLICSDLFGKQLGRNRSTSEQIGANWGIPENKEHKSEQIGVTPFCRGSEVKSPFCPVYPWDGWGFVPETVVLQGPSEKCLCVFFLRFLGYFRPPI